MTVSSRSCCANFADRLMPLPAAGGLHLAAFLESGEPGRDLVIAERAREKGVALIPLSYHYLGRGVRPGFLLGYGGIATPRITEGLRRLRECV